MKHKISLKKIKGVSTMQLRLSDLVARTRRIQADVLSQNLVQFGAVGLRESF